MLGGLAANTTAPGPAPAGNSSAAPCQVRFRELANTGGRPAGSITIKLAAAPRASQPRSIAEPICPQPTRTSVSALAMAGSVASLMTGPAAGSGLADRLDHCRRHRLFGRLAAPDHQLEDRIEALALRQGG